MQAWGIALIVGIAALLATPEARAEDGRIIYTQACAQCHASGVAGAPKLGDKPAWKERLSGGRDAMLAVVLKGKGAMPAKGGNASLSDAAAGAALDYILSQVKSPR